MRERKPYRVCYSTERQAATSRTFATEAEVVKFLRGLPAERLRGVFVDSQELDKAALGTLWKRAKESAKG